MVAVALVWPMTGSAAEEEGETGALSFFDYLGTMVQEDGVWVDPLVLEEGELVQHQRPEDSTPSTDSAEREEDQR